MVKLLQSPESDMELARCPENPSLRGDLPSGGLRTFSMITIWLFNIAMENGPLIDDFPIRTSVYSGFSMAMLNNQMVHGSNLAEPQVRRWMILDYCILLESYIQRIPKEMARKAGTKSDPLGRRNWAHWLSKKPPAADSERPLVAARATSKVELKTQQKRRRNYPPGLVVWNRTGLFFHILGTIILTNSYFSEGFKPQTSSHISTWGCLKQIGYL